MQLAERKQKGNLVGPRVASNSHYSVLKPHLFSLYYYSLIINPNMSYSTGENGPAMAVRQNSAPGGAMTGPVATNSPLKNVSGNSIVPVSSFSST